MTQVAEGMRKVEKTFKLLKWIRVAPGLNVDTLGGLLDTHVRSIYRYIDDLRTMGIAIRNENGGYALDDDNILGAIKLSDQDAPESETGPGGARDQIPFEPREVVVEIGAGSDADLSLAYGDTDNYHKPLRLLQNDRFQVNVLTGGVKVKAVDPDRGMGSVMVRWR